MDEQPAAKSKRHKKSNKSSKSFWGAANGWKPLSVDDELLLGAEEGGFAGLEVLEDVSLIGSAYLKSLGTAAKQQQEPHGAADSGKQQIKTKKQSKLQLQQESQPQLQQQQQQQMLKGKRKSAGSEGQAANLDTAAANGADDVAALKAKLQQVEAENRALKRQKREAKAASGVAHAAPAAAKDGNGSANAAQAAGEDRQAAKTRKERRYEQLKQKRKEKKLQARQKRVEAKNDKQQKAGPDKQQQQGRQQRQQRQDNRHALLQNDMSAWAKFCFDPRLLQALAAQGFTSPTPIQDAVLLPAVRDRRDVIGAAQTGSGKTLAFGLPILQVLAQEQEVQQLKQQQEQQALPDEVIAMAVASSKRANKAGDALRALILAPTRELALQVADHLQAFGIAVGIRVTALVGGIAPVKQERLLRAKPPVIVATPGRLWDLMQQGHRHLTELDDLSFFVLDEADRMVQQGHYQELSHILELLPTVQRAAVVAAAAQAEAQEKAELQNKNTGKTQESQKSDEQDQQQAEQAEQPASNQPEADQQQQQKGQHKQANSPKRHLCQTFVFSATLMLPAAMHKRLRRGGGGSSGAASLESLMDRLTFRDRPAIVDLAPPTMLAERVAEGLLRCLGEERDATLYYVLARHPGRALVFVNAVSAVRRVGALLQLLGLPAYALHAQQQQRQRLKALDRFKQHPHGVLVATDVAARGLDIPDVQIVVHYQLPASADTFIHRSGRTARTGSSNGVVLSLITPEDASRWAALRKALQGQPEPPAFPVDDKVLLAAKQRVALAAKIDAIQRKERKQHAAATWARSNAEAVGIELTDRDEDACMVEAVGAGTQAKKRKRSKQVLALAAAVADDDQTAADKAHAAGQLAKTLGSLQRQLAAALSTPLQPSISHKFFTGGMSRAVAVAAATTKPAGTAVAAEQGTAGADGAAGLNSGRSEDAQSNGDAAVAIKPVSVFPAEAIARTMQLAAKLKSSKAGDVAAAGGTGGLAARSAKKLKPTATAKDSSKERRKAAAAALAAAAAGKRGALLAGKLGKGKASVLQQQQGLARLMMSRNEIKRQKRQGGMVVVRPGAGVFGRDAQGVSALEALNSSK